MVTRAAIVAAVVLACGPAAAPAQVQLRNWDNTWVLTNTPRPDFARIRRYRAAHRDEYRRLAQQAAEKYGIRYELLDALIVAESNYNPRAVSSKGAVGLTQLMPRTAAGLGVSDSFDPAQNIDGGARYLREMLDRFGDERLALAAYNAGPAAVEKYGGVPPYRETQGYVASIGAKLSVDTAAVKSSPKAPTYKTTKRKTKIKVKQAEGGQVIISN